MAIRKATTKKISNTKYTVIENCGKIDNIRLTYGKWNDNNEKYDLRTWYRNRDTGEEKAGKGISLTGEQLENLYKILKKMVEE